LLRSNFCLLTSYLRYDLAVVDTKALAVRYEVVDESTSSPAID
jgi:hypothetical protein